MRTMHRGEGVHRCLELQTSNLTFTHDGATSFTGYTRLSTPDHTPCTSTDTLTQNITCNKKSNKHTIFH